MAKGIFSIFSREPAAGVQTEPSDEPVRPARGSGAAVAQIVREIARQELPVTTRKAAISLRLDADILDWFRAQGPGYQTRINAVLRAYRDAAG